MSEGIDGKHRSEAARGWHGLTPIRSLLAGARLSYFRLVQRVVLDVVGVTGISCDNNGRIRWIGRSAHQRGAFAAGQIGERAMSCVVRRDRRALIAALRQQTITGKAFSIGLNVYDEGTGTILVGVTMPPPSYGANKRRRFFYIRTVDPKLHAGKRLDHRDEQFRLLADLYPAGIFLTEPDNLCSYANLAWQKLSQSRSIGGHWTDAVHPDDRSRVSLEWASSVARGVDYRTECRFTREDGTLLWIDLIGTARRSADGEFLGYAGVNIDITARKAADAELEAAVARANRSTASKSAFLANMSHEIRTPMNGVIGFTELLLREELSSTQRRYVEAVDQCGHAMLGVLNDILDFSRIEANVVEIIEETFSIRELLDSIDQCVQPLAHSKSLALTTIVEASVPAVVSGDHRHFRQIVLNLVSNALKFTMTGSIIIQADYRSGQLLVRCLDSGCGIPAERRDAVFEPFVQANARSGQRLGGSGLGLAISLRLARLMQGDLRLVRTGDTGSTFELTLPLASASMPDTKRAEPEVDLPPLKVLVAEDVPINRLLIQTILCQSGHRVTLASDGEEAVGAFHAASATSEHFDLILMDVRMPRMDGLEATRLIRASGGIGAAIPIIALTANAYETDALQCQVAGMNGHLAKPLDVDMLNRAIADHCLGQNALSTQREPAKAVCAPTQFDTALGALPSVARKNILATLAEDLAKLSSTALAALEHHDVAQSTNALHALKGTASGFGLEKLGNACADAEREIAAHGFDHPERWSGLDAAIDEAAATVAAYVARAAAPNRVAQ